MFERVNLVPQPPLAERIKKITPLLSGGIFIVGCLAVYFMGSLLAGDNRRLNREIDMLEQHKASNKEQEIAIGRLNQAIEKLKEEEKDLRKNVAHLMQIPSQKPYYSELLIHIGKCVPATVRCGKISFNENGGLISGTATKYRDLPAFVDKISKMGRFHSVVLQLVDQLGGEDGDLLSFTIVFGLRDVASR